MRQASVRQSGRARAQLGAPTSFRSAIVFSPVGFEYAADDSPTAGAKRLPRSQHQMACSKRAQVPRLFVLATLLGCLGLIGWSVAALIQQETELRAVARESQVLETQLAAIQGRNSQLRSEIVRLGSDDYIETVARQQLGLIRPGEIPYIAVEGPSAAGGREQHDTPGSVSRP